MDLIVETVKRTIADQKRSCGYAPYIQMLINSKVGNNVYLLDRKHLPLQPELEDCIVTMDASHRSSAIAQEQAEAARATAQTNGPNTSTAELPKTKNDQMMYLLLATQRIEQGLANLVKNQESLERIVETKFHDLDVKVTEMATDQEKLKADVEAKLSDDDDDVPPTTTQFQTQPRSATVVVSSFTPTTVAASTVVPPPVSTPPVQQTSSEAFADGLLSTPSTHTGAASQRTSSPTAVDRAQSDV